MSEIKPQRSLMQLAREAREKKAAAAAQAPPPAPAVPSPPSKGPQAAKPPAAKAPPQQRPGKPPVIRLEQLTAACGHLVPFEVYEDRKDKFRAERRKKTLENKCKACRIEGHYKRQMEAKNAALASRYARGPGKPWRGKLKGRLPAGSQFLARYDGEKWIAVLTVPGVQQDFVGTAGGVFNALPRADDQYQLYLEAQGKPPEGEVPQPEERPPEAPEQKESKDERPAG